MKAHLTFSQIKAIDPGDMLGKTLELDRQIEQGLRLGKDFTAQSTLAIPPQLDWFGLGGSAIVGDLIDGLGFCPVPFRVLRQPGSATERSATPRIVYSYSGDTAEALHAFGEGLETGGVWLTASSGGELAVRATDAKVPHLMLPTGYPPRAAVGFGLGAFMALFAELSHREVPWSAREGEVLAEDAKSYEGLDSNKNPALRLAEELVDRTPVLYAVDPILGPSLMRRACAQLAENAKKWSHGVVLPELAHNEVEAFPALAALLPPPLVLLVGSWPFARFPYSCEPIETLLSELRIEWRRVQFPAQERKPREQLLEGLRTMLFLDAVSVWLALIHATDPMTIPTITRLKSMQTST